MLDTLAPAPVVSAAAADAGPTLVSRVYCGRCIPGGDAVVTDADLYGFISEVVAQRFPAGFTVLHGAGGWRDQASGRAIQEQSVVFEMFHGPAQSADVYAVASAYKAKFRQDAVGLTTSPVAVTFI